MPDGPRATRVRAARRLHRRPARLEARLFLAEGPPSVREALVSGAAREVFVTPGAAGRQARLIAHARDVAEVREVTDDALAALCTTVAPQGIVATCAFVDVDLAAALAGSPRLVAVLAFVRDPGNAGTVIRTADAAGAAAVLLSTESVDVYNAKCVRSSAGSMFHLPVVNGAELGEIVDGARAAGLTVVAAEAGADRSIDDAAGCGELSRPTAWMFGNEAWGLPDTATELADVALRVPIHGRAESLNLAASAAVCLYVTACAQRDDTSAPRGRGRTLGGPARGGCA